VEVSSGARGQATSNRGQATSNRGQATSNRRPLHDHQCHRRSPGRGVERHITAPGQSQRRFRAPPTPTRSLDPRRPDPLLVRPRRAARGCLPHRRRFPANAATERAPQDHRRGDRDAVRCPADHENRRSAAHRPRRQAPFASAPHDPTRDAFHKPPLQAVRPDPGADRALRASEAQRCFDELPLIDPTPVQCARSKETVNPGGSPSLPHTRSPTPPTIATAPATATCSSSSARRALFAPDRTPTALEPTSPKIDQKLIWDEMVSDGRTNR